MCIFGINAGIAQLVERNLAKVDVAGSNPVSRSALRGREHSAIAPDVPVQTLPLLKVAPPPPIPPGGGVFLYRATYPSGKGEVCKTFMHRFESGRRLCSPWCAAGVAKLVDAQDLKS